MLAYTVHIVFRELWFQWTIALPIAAKDASAAGEERAPGIWYVHCGCQVLDLGVWGAKGAADVALAVGPSAPLHARYGGKRPLCSSGCGSKAPLLLPACPSFLGARLHGLECRMLVVFPSCREVKEGNTTRVGSGIVLLSVRDNGERQHDECLWAEEGGCNVHNVGKCVVCWRLPSILVPPPFAIQGVGCG